MTVKNIRIEFLQQNCRKMASVANELHILASQNEATIICMQEPSFQVRKTEKLTGFNNLSHYHDANTASNKVRAAIVASRMLNCLYHSDYSEKDMTTISVNIDGKDTFITSVYWEGDPTSSPLPEKLTELLAHVKTNNNPLVICMDSNAHSSMWGSPETDQRGQELEDLLLENDLILLNGSNTAPTFIGATSKEGTHIDITAVSLNTSPKYINWHLSNEVTLSDHRLIRFNYKYTSKVRIEQPWAFKKCNWDEFRANMNKNWTNPILWTIPIIEKEVEELLSDIKSSLKKSCPKKSPYGVCPRKSSRINNWWDTSAELARENSMRLRQEYLNWIRQRKRLLNSYPDTESLLDTTENHINDELDELENIDLLNRSQESDEETFILQPTNNIGSTSHLNLLNHETLQEDNKPVSKLRNNSEFLLD